MLCLSGFELYSRWVPLTEARTKKENNDEAQYTTVLKRQPKMNSNTAFLPLFDLLFRLLRLLKRN